MRTTSLGRRPLVHRLVAGGLAAAAGLTIAFAVAAPARADSNVDEAQFVAAINGVRVRNGLRPLATDGQLISVARSWSSQMAGAGGLSHNPNLSGQISDWRSLGENVGTGGDVATIEAAFEASPHHYENMVDPNFTYVGVGVVEVGGTIWVTEDYKQSKSGLPSTAVPAPAPKPSPRPASPSAPGTGSAPARRSPSSSARPSPAAVAAAHSPSPGASDAAATPAPSSPAPGPTSEPAKSPKALPARLAVVSAPRGLDTPRLAALALFAVLGSVTLLGSRGLLPLPARRTS